MFAYKTNEGLNYSNIWGQPFVLHLQRHKKTKTERSGVFFKILKMYISQLAVK